MICQKTGKAAYQTPQAAAQVRFILAGAKRSYQAKSHWCKGQLNHYRCEYCGKWHMGHKARGK